MCSIMLPEDQGHVRRRGHRSHATYGGLERSEVVHSNLMIKPRLDVVEIADACARTSLDEGINCESLISGATAMGPFVWSFPTVSPISH